jgi:hypothetical protein
MLFGIIRDEIVKLETALPIAVCVERLKSVTAESFVSRLAIFDSKPVEGSVDATGFRWRRTAGRRNGLKLKLDGHISENEGLTVMACRFGIGWPSRLGILITSIFLINVCLYSYFGTTPVHIDQGSISAIATKLTTTFGILTVFSVGMTLSVVSAAHDRTFMINLLAETIGTKPHDTKKIAQRSASAKNVARAVRRYPTVER